MCYQSKYEQQMHVNYHKTFPSELTSQATTTIIYKSDKGSEIVKQLPLAIQNPRKKLIRISKEHISLPVR